MTVQSLNFTLVADGTSDRALIWPLMWLLKHSLPNTSIRGALADTYQAVPKPRTLLQKITYAVEFFPCDVLFVHRDAENEARSSRIAEITTAITMLRTMGKNTPFVCVIPVRMTEAWLLIDEKAIRYAAGNPYGRTRLDMPRIRDLENMVDPKAVLFDLLETASGLSGRHLKNFNRNLGRQQIAEFIEDYSPLRQISAFQALEADITAWNATKHG